MSDTPLPLVLPAGPTKSDGARAPADVVAGHGRGRLPRDRRHEPRRAARPSCCRATARSIAQRAAAAGAAGASALVLYGDGGAPAGALGLDDRVKLPIVVLPGDQGAAAAATLLTGGAVTITFSTAHSDDNPAGRLGRAVLVHRPRLRRLDQARPRRARRGRHDLGAGRRLPGRERHVGRRGAGRRASRRSCCRRIPTWTPRDRARRARRHGHRPWAATGDGPAPVEAQGGGAVDIAAAQSRPRSSPSPSSLTFGLARAPRVKVTRVLTLANTGSATVHVSLALEPRRRRRRRLHGRAHRRAVRRSRSRRARPCPCR